MTTFKTFLALLVLPLLMTFIPMEKKQTLSVPHLADKAIPATVGFMVNMPGGWSMGTGVIVTPTGYVISCAHVFPEQHGGITAIVFDGTSHGLRIPAKIVMIDRQLDIAILKLDGKNKHLHYAKLGDSDKVRRGEFVMAIGFPHELVFRWTLTTGVVSGLHRYTTDLIQSDTVINSGNSGGPLFNRKGQVIGINAQIYGPKEFDGWTGITLSIPIDKVKTFLFAAEAH